MASFKSMKRITGWLVFIVAMIVYVFSVERTGSLWDCGEFILGAHKLQVVHPPGAPLFLLVGRFFGLAGELFSSDPAAIAFMINMLSATCSAFAAMFVGLTTIMLGKVSLVGREEDPSLAQSIALNAAGLVAGLSSAFITSIWFSAVEGEVYAMSTFFTAMTLWAMVKFYTLPEGARADKWMVFALFSVGLSVGVHLLSLLTIPALSLFYYWKKYKKHTPLGTIVAILVGLVFLFFVQKIIIVGIPTLWAGFDKFFVNSLGLPFLSGILPTFLLIAGLIVFGLHYSHRKKNQFLQFAFVVTALCVIGFSTFGIVIIRANANPPVNMNNPSDPMRLIPYLNREQYGERALLKGPNYDGLTPISYDQTERYGKVGNRYEIIDYKVKPVYKKSDQTLFPRMSDGTQNRPNLYKQWSGDPKGNPSFVDNIGFFFRYQIGWMYVRYFMWNFAGRQNGEQGYYDWNEKDGNWISGITPLDDALHYETSDLPDTIKNHKKNNKYFFIPLILGILGMLFHYSKSKKDFLTLLILFAITGIGIIVYSNQPPNEPRERDYALAGSFFTFCIWVGMGVLCLFNLFKKRISALSATPSAFLAGGLGLLAPILLLTQNFDDHSRADHSGARDYASNFLESCDPYGIIFTYGDNDTYPLWYAQEIEGIRTDVRVINLSLINVDWYIDQMRRKVNESPAVKMSIPSSAYQGYKRTQIPVQKSNPGEAMDVRNALKYLASDRNDLPGQGYSKILTILPASNLILPIDPVRAHAVGLLSPQDTAANPRLEFTIPGSYILKGDMALIDIITQNIYDRPIYFSVTTQQKKMLGLNDFTQLEGLGLRIIPVKTPSNSSLGIFGSGRVDTDKLHERLTQKFKWGGFDKNDLFVSNSYIPSTAAHRMIMWRGMNELITQRNLVKAGDICQKYFEAFPHMNFPYDHASIPFINGLINAGRVDEAKKHLNILIEEVRQHMVFFASLDEEDLNNTWRNDASAWNSCMNSLKQSTLPVLKDQELTARFNEQLGPYFATPIQN